MSLIRTTNQIDRLMPLAEAEAIAEASPPGSVQSQFLQALPRAEYAQIFSLAEQVADALGCWAARYPLIRRVRVRPLSLSVVAAAPFDTLDALITTAKVSLWVFTLDDLFDEEGLSAGELVRRARHYRQITRGEFSGPWDDSLAVALADVRRDLVRFPLFALLKDEWSKALIGTIDGMIREQYWRRQLRRHGNKALPSYEAYVANGRYSIGGPPHIWSALITTNDPSTLDHLDLLRSMEEIASRCVRLANDLRSYGKEINEEKINSLLLVGRNLAERGLPEYARHDRAETFIRGEIARGLADLSELHARAHTQTKHPETAIARIAHFVCEFYTYYDYHTFQSWR
ncbi:MAG TPA: terpene synthase family protein [Chloroflexota bacterium]|nr:terpene synthase family protein [Chloroflexota bacterium]